MIEHSETVKTKFNPGDKVYFLLDNGIHEGTVNKINIVVESTETLATYEVEYINSYAYSVAQLNGNKLFESPKAVVDKMMLEFENTREKK